MRHVFHAEVVGNVRVELTRKIFDTFFALAFKDCFDTPEDSVADKNSFFGKFSKGHTLDVIANFDNTFLHKFLIKNELDQFLHLRIKF